MLILVTLNTECIKLTAQNDCCWLQPMLRHMASYRSAVFPDAAYILDIFIVTSTLYPPLEVTDEVEYNFLKYLIFTNVHEV